MSPSAVALGVIFAIVAIASVIGFYAGARRKMDLEQWTVAGRGFGTLLMWLLMAGEVYTTFSFLGASGWRDGSRDKRLVLALLRDAVQRISGVPETFQHQG